MNAIETVNLSKRYGPREVVHPLTLSVPAGSVFGYLGPNGAGKTTTLRLLSGVLAPSGGSGMVAGASLSRPEDVKARIGYANQAASVYPDLTVTENLRFKAALYLSAREVERAVQDTLDRLGLGAWRDTLAARLSGGWRQRLCIGTALVHGPQVLFLDEPTAGLDPLARRDLWDVIYALTARGTTVFVTTHYMDEAERCQRLALIASGTVLAQGTPHDLRESLGGVRFTLRGPDLSALLGAARVTPGVGGAWIIGDEVRVTAPDAAPGAALRALGAVQEVPATLEDVFVAYAAAHPTRPAEVTA